MSQQELVPEPPSNGQDSSSEDESYTPQPYYWSTRPQAEGMPKEEPLSGYDEHTFEQGYQAQDNTVRPNIEPTLSYEEWKQQQTQQPDPNSNPYGSTYGGYQHQQYQQPGMQQNVPPGFQGFQPQRNRSNPIGLAILVVIGLILLSGFFNLFGMFGPGHMGGGFWFPVIPLIFIFGLGRMFRRGYRRRGPWRW